MAHTKGKRRRRLKVWQRLALALAIIVVLCICSTLFLNFPLTTDTTTATAEESGWDDPVYGYVMADEGSLTVPFYSESLTELFQCGRGTEVEMESTDPFVSETGREYYHVFLDGQFGYILCDNITDDKSDLLQETQVYVRTPVNLLTGPESLTLGSLAEKGTLLRVVGYDYFKSDGTVNMYEVKMGTEIGWIHATYVSLTYAEAMENWTNDSGAYKNHVSRGDEYGGGDAADLDYWEHEKGDFSDEGNVMPDACYALLLPAAATTPEIVQQYLDMAEGTEINTLVFTIYDEEELAYESDVLAEYGLLDSYTCHNTVEEFASAVKLAQDAGYYTVARITTFRDSGLARAYPEWSITDENGNIMELNGAYWPSVYCREVWELKVALACEVVDTFGFNEIQFDYVRFPDYIINYEEEGTVDLKNTYDESKAQAVQRFLTYACDILHDHGAYVAADVFGETSNTYVAPYGQYWPAISTVVDVICGMPYPDHYNSYYSNGSYYVPYKHPYQTLNDWANRVVLRQEECASPAIVRTWIQTWNDADYEYDDLAIQREILGLYDADVTGGYMLWYGYGTLEVAEDVDEVIQYDYYALYQEAQAAGQDLSEYMNITTGEEIEDEDE